MAERIYITEDDDSIRELVTVALSAYSYEVESFVSAEDCLAATEKQVPDIFLFFRFSGIYYSLKVKESSVMESTIARDSSLTPISRIF